MTEHSELPWHTYLGVNHANLFIADANSSIVIEAPAARQTEANYLLIVDSVNKVHKYEKALKVAEKFVERKAQEMSDKYAGGNMLTDCDSREFERTCEVGRVINEALKHNETGSE